MSLSFEMNNKVGSEKKAFEIYPADKSEAVCFQVIQGVERRSVKVDTKGPEDVPAAGVKLKGWGHVHQNTETGKLFKDHGNDDFDWKPCDPEYDFKYVQFFFVQSKDVQGELCRDFDESGFAKEKPSGAWIRSRKMTASAAQNSALRAFLKHWGVKVPAHDDWDALKSFDIRGETVGRKAALTVVHAVGTKFTFANIETCHPVD